MIEEALVGLYGVAACLFIAQINQMGVRAGRDLMAFEEHLYESPTAAVAQHCHRLPMSPCQLVVLTGAGADVCPAPQRLTPRRHYQLRLDCSARLGGLEWSLFRHQRQLTW